jgi:hypothetical protein
MHLILDSRSDSSGKPRKSRYPGIWVIIGIVSGILLVIFIAVIIFIVIRSRSKSNQNHKPSPPPRRRLFN